MKNKTKRIITSLTSFLVASNFLMYSAMLSGGNVLKDLVQTETVSAAGAARPGYDAVGTATSGASGSWLSDGTSLTLKIFPADIDKASEGQNASAAKGRYDYDGYALFVNISGSTASKYLSVSDAQVGVPSGYNTVDIRPNINLNLSNFGGSDAFAKFVNCASGASLQNTGGMINNMNALLNAEAEDSIYKAYIDYITNYYGKEAADDINKNLYNQGSENFKGERKFTLIVEPLTALTNRTGGYNAYLSLYNGLKFINNTRYGDAAVGGTVCNINSVFAGEKMRYIDNASGGWYTKNGSPAWTSSGMTGYSWLGGAPSGDDSPINASAYIYPLRAVIPSIRDGVTNVNSSVRANIGNHVGWTWFSIANSKYYAPSVYDVVEYPTFDGIPTDAMDENVTIGQNTYPLQTALSNGLLNNDRIVQNYYRKTTGGWNTDTVKVLDLTADAEKYIVPDKNETAEATKQNAGSKAYYRSVSPYQDLKAFVSLKSSSLKKDELFKNKEDYIVSAGTKTDDNTVAPTGKLNYSKTLKYTEALNTTLLDSDSSVKPNVDFTLQKINVYVSNRSETNNIELYRYWELTDADVDAFVAKVSNQGYFDMSNSSAIKAKDLSGNSSDVMYTWFNSRTYTIRVVYEYAQGDPANPISIETGGSFETEIPEYLINRNYKNGLSDGTKDNIGGVNNLSSYFMLNGEKVLTNDLEKAHIYAPILKDKKYVKDGKLLRDLECCLWTIPLGVFGEFKLGSGATGDERLYNTFMYEKGSLPSITSYFNSYYTIADGKYKGMWADTIASEAKYDTSFIASKNFMEDNIKLADWVEATGGNKVLESLLKGNRGLPQLQRDVTGKYTMFSDGILFGTNTQTIDNKNVVSNEVDIRTMPVADTVYDTTCKIRNYVPSDTPTASVEERKVQNENSFVDIIKTNLVTFVPEVTMLYSSEADKSLSKIAVQGNKNRKCEIGAYNTITSSINTKITTVGTMPATDSRATTLREKVCPGSNAPVLYGGSEVLANVAEVDSSITFTSYVMDVKDKQGVVTRTGKSADEVALDWLSQYVANDANGKNVIKSTLTATNNVYTDWKNTKPEMTFNFENIPLEFRSDQSDGKIAYAMPTTYDLVVRDGKVTNILNSSTGDSIPISDPVWKAVTELKLNDVFSACLETSNSANNTSCAITDSEAKAMYQIISWLNGTSMEDRINHWYSEDTSIFQLKCYSVKVSCNDSAQVTAKIPINAGPATASDKNAFNNGYGVYVSSSISLKDMILGTTEKVTTSKPSYIIPDRTIQDTY